MAYRHDGSGMGGGPLDPKVVGWLWGFMIGVVSTLILEIILTWPLVPVMMLGQF